MNPIYRQLRDDDDFDVSEKDNGEETSFLSPDNGLRRVTQRSLLTFTVCNVVLFAASLALFIQPLAFHSTSQLNPELRRTSTYSMYYAHLGSSKQPDIGIANLHRSRS